MPDLASELIGLDPSIIVTSTAAATRAVKRATSTNPILMVTINYDPVAFAHVRLDQFSQSTTHRE
jgi:hypothetical protein